MKAPGWVETSETAKPDVQRDTHPESMLYRAFQLGYKTVDQM